MTWLSGWLHELILVVLLAAFVEMLLPSKSMERYARLVLSLLVLLTMLSPVVSLLKGDAGKELSLALSQQEKSGGLLSESEGGADPLEKILADGRMLAAGARDQSLKLAAEEIAGQMRDQITGETGLRGAGVTVTLGMSPVPGGLSGEEVPVIASVTVTLPEAVNGAADSAQGSADADAVAAAPGTAGSPIQIDPVKPVQVSLDGGGEDSAAAGAAGEDRGTAAAGTDAEAGTGTIIRLLEKNWNLDPELIHVQTSGTTTVKS